MNSYQPLNIIFYKGNSLIGRLIKFISRSKNYSHCAFILDDWHCVETSWNTPTVIKHFAYKNNSFDIYKLNIELTDEQKEKIIKYIRKNISNGYDFLYVITRGLHILFGTPIKNSKKTISCDELVTEAFKEIEIKLVDDDIILTPESLSKSKYLTKVK